MSNGVRETMDVVRWKVGSDVRMLRRWLAVWWATIGCAFLRPWLPGQGSEVQGVVEWIVLAALVIQGALITANLVHEDPPFGTATGWKTRPVRPFHLWLAKATFVVLALLLPATLATLVSVGAREGAVKTALSLAGETAFYLACLCGVSAALACAGPGLFRFIMTAVLAAAALSLWSQVFGWLHSAVGASDAVSTDPAFSRLLDAALVTSSMAVMLGVACAGGWASWWLSFQTRFRWNAFLPLGVAFVLLPVIANLWPVAFLRPHSPRPAGITVAVRPMTNPPAGPWVAQGQRVFSAFDVLGVPPGQMASLAGLHVRGTTEAGQTATAHIASQDSLAQPLFPFGASWDSHAWIELVTQQYPEDLQWRRPHAAHASLANLPWRNERGEPVRFSGRTLNVEGDVIFDISQLERIADLPAQLGASSRWAGCQVQVQDVELNENHIQIILEMRRPARLLTRQPDQSIVRTLPASGWVDLVVVVHPATREAVLAVAEPQPGLMPGPGLKSRRKTVSTAYPEVRARLSGVSRGEWLRGARIHCYVLTTRGRVTWPLAGVELPLRPAPGFSGSQAEAGRRLELEAISLPSSASPDAVRAYVDNLMLAMPDFAGSGEIATAYSRLMESGPAGVVPLLAHAPFTDFHRKAFVLPYLERNASTEHLALLEEALRRDPQLATLFARKGWIVEGRRALDEVLRERRRPLPAPALMLIAAAKDPATYAALSWHFVRLESNHAEVLDSLRACPGFDLAPTVAEAWHRARLGRASVGQLSLPAAQQGLPGALASAVRRLEEPLPAEERNRWISGLAELTDGPSPEDGLVQWLRDRVGRLEYDAASGRYHAAP